MSKLVIPGDFLTEKPIRSPYVFGKGGKCYAAVIGVYEADTNKFIPLKGAYLPQIGDVVIGVVEEERVIGYDINLFGPYKGLLFSRGLRSPLNPGEIITAEISELSEVKDVVLSRPRKLFGGQIIFIPPTKVSRVIGKQMSMLQLLQRGTGCEIYIGKNGAIWIKGANPEKAIEAVLKIERESHTKGLTERIQKFLGVEATQEPQSPPKAASSEQSEPSSFE